MSSMAGKTIEKIVRCRRLLKACYTPDWNNERNFGFRIYFIQYVLLSSPNSDLICLSNLSVRFEIYNTLRKKVTDGKVEKRKRCGQKMMYFVSLELHLVSLPHSAATWSLWKGVTDSIYSESIYVCQLQIEKETFFFRTLLFWKAWNRNRSYFSFYSFATISRNNLGCST